MSDFSRISVAIVDDHPILRHGLAAVLRNEPRFRFVAEGGSATDALQIAQLHRPDIMIIDLNIPGCGIAALKQIVVEFPSVRCIILTVCDSADTAIGALNAGAQGYVLKGVSAADLKSAIWTVFNNESFVSPEFATKILLAAQNQKNHDTSIADDRLSFRESKILREVEAGLTNRMVAEKLRISERTVKHYMSSIMQKYGVNNRVSAVIAYQKVRQSRPNA
jgi:two-component system, NarL family, nitrate/nitrite response regulator NarL